MDEPRIGSVVGGVRLDEVIGRGGMGVVYRGHDPKLNRTVAVKVVRAALAENDEFRRRFQRECTLAAAFDHPHVVPIHSAGEDDGRLYVVMRYVAGTDLREAIREQGRIPLARAARIVAQVGSALDAAHAHGLVHRDVKPANILVTSVDGRPHTYLTDFGLTRLAASSTSVTPSGAVVGTLDYMAPEQFASRQVDRRADVYALGCVLYTATTGAVPFPRESDAAKVSAHLFEPHPPARTAVNGLPPELDAVLTRALAKEPDQRFNSAGALGRAVLAIVDGATSATRGAIPAVDAEAVSATTSLSTVVMEPPVTTPARATQSAMPTTASPRVPPRPSSDLSTQRPFVPPPRGFVPLGGPSSPGDPLPPDSSWPPHDPRVLLGEPRRPGRRRRRLLLAAGAVVAALLVAAGIVGSTALRSSSAGPATAPATASAPASAPVATVTGSPVPVGRHPRVLVAESGFLWSADFGDPGQDDGTVSKIDPRSGTSRQIATKGNPWTLAVEPGAVWFANYTNQIGRIDVASGRLTTVPVTPGVTGIAVAGGYLWVTNAQEGTLTPIDTATQRIAGPPIRLGRPGDIAYDNGRLYVADSGPNSVVVVDVATGHVLPSPALPAHVLGLIVAGGTVWVTTTDDSAPADQRRLTVTPVDEATMTAGPPLAIHGAGSFATDGQRLWVGYPGVDEMRALDPRTGALLGAPVRGVSRGFSDVGVFGPEVWFADTVDSTVVRARLGG